MRIVWLTAGMACLLLVPGRGLGEEASPGPVVEKFGPVFDVPSGSYNLDPTQRYRVVMDVGEGPEDESSLNRRIESAARFLNMHARSGIDAEQIDFALVLHGGGARAALSDAAYRKRFGTANPDRAMIRALANAGVQVYLCGQSAGFRGFGTDELLPEVAMAVSAMTVHVRLQSEGYRGILF